MLNNTNHALILFIAANLFYISIIAQEPVQGPHEGKGTYKVGDLVEATFAGSWVKAEVVGADEALAKYKIHFEGEKYCNDHATDSYLAREWLRPRKTSRSITTPTQATLPVPETSTPTVNAGKFKTGDKVIYTNVGSIWLGGATVESYDPIKRAYKLRLQGGSGDIVPCYAVAKPGEFDNSFFIGKWDVYVNGAVTTKVKEGIVYDQFSGGLKLAPLEIRANGTYTWRVKGKKDIIGTWKPKNDSPGITIMKGMDGVDWTVYEKTEGFASSATTRDEIGFHDKKLQTGYYVAYRIGANQSCVLAGRSLK